MYIFVTGEMETKDETNIEGPSNVPEVNKEEEEPPKKSKSFLHL